MTGGVLSALLVLYCIPGTQKMIALLIGTQYLLVELMNTISLIYGESVQSKVSLLSYLQVIFPLW